LKHYSNIEKAKRYFKKSISIHTKSQTDSDKLGYLNAIGELGIIEKDLGNYKTSIKLLIESLDISKKLKLISHTAGILSNLGNATFLNGDYSKGIKLQNQSLKIYKKLGNKIQISRITNNLGYMYLLSGNYFKAKEYFEDGLSLSIEINDKFTEAMTSINLGSLLKLSGEYLKSYPYFKKSLSIMKNIGFKRGIAMSIGNISEINFELENYKTSTLLISFNESLKKSMPKNDLLLIKKHIFRLRKKLSIEDFSKYWEEGRAMTFEQAVNLALSMSDEY